MRKHSKKWMIAVPLCVSLTLSLSAPALAVETQAGQSGTEAAQTADAPEVSGLDELRELLGPNTLSGLNNSSGSKVQGSLGAGTVQIQAPGDDLDLGNKIVGEPYDDQGLLTYRSENGAVTIMSCSDAAVGELYIPASINGEPVTAIHDYAFLYCASLTAVTVPATVTQVGANAFSCCTQLAAVTFEGENVSVGRRAFYLCGDLTQVHFQGAVTALGEYAFAYCTSLTTVDYPQGVGEIGDYAFYKCAALTGLPIQAGGRSVSVGSYAFSACDGLVDVTVPATVSSLGDRVFSQCANLERVVLDDGMPGDQVGTGLFYQCYKLTTVHLPENWTVIPDETFYSCWKLEYTLPDHLTRIGAYAFKSCVGLPKDLVIPAGVTEIGEGAFQSCASTSVALPEGLTQIKAYTFDNGSGTLAHVTLPEGLIYVGTYAFGGNCLESLTLPSTLLALDDCAFCIRDSAYRVNASGGSGKVTGIKLPAGLKYLGKEALSCCSGLEELILPEGLLYFGGSFGRIKRVVLPASLEKIEDSAFYNSGLQEAVILCPASAFSGAKVFYDGLTSVTITGTWTEIPANMFEGSSLVNVTILEGVTAIGESAFADCASLKNVQLPGTLTAIGANAFSGTAALTDIVLPDSLTELGDRAFASSALTSLTLPKNLNKMGSYVFASCDALTNVTVHGDVNGKLTFYECNNLTTATFASGASVIGASCFADCAGLQTVLLSDTVREIGENAFLNCTALTSIRLPEGLEIIGDSAFRGTALTAVSLPSTLTKVGAQAFGTPALTTVNLAENLANDAFGDQDDASSSGAFYGCTALRSINIPGSWTYIPAKFLGGCGGPLGKITLGDNITAIGAGAFRDAVGVTAITLPEGLQSLGAYALYGCTGLTELCLPDGLPEDGLGEYAIGGCSNLKTVSLPNSWTSIPDALFRGNRSIEAYDIPEGITRIGEYAFADTALKELKLPSTVTAIGAHAFENCAGVTQVTLPDGLKSLGSYAFRGTGMTEVTVPGGVDVIEKMAFYDCDSLISVVIQPGVTTIEDQAFGDCDKLTRISIPDSAVNLARTILYGSNPGDVTVQCSAGSMAEELVKSLPYLSSGGFPVLEGARFYSADSSTDGGYYLEYQGMIFYISGEETDQPYVEKNDVSRYHAALLDWDPAFTSLEVPDDLCGIPVTSFGDSTRKWLTTAAAAQAAGDLVAAYGTGDSQLRSLTVGANMQTLGGSLSSCTNLEEIILKEGFTSIDAETFGGLTKFSSVKLPAGLREIGDSTFQGCTRLKEITLPEGLECVGEYAFSATGLTAVTIPGSVDTVGRMAFYNCNSLISAVIEPGVTTVGHLAFGYCDRLTEVTLPDSAVNLARSIFYGSNQGKVSVHCSAGSMAEELAKSLLYVSSDNSPAPEGARFYFVANDTEWLNLSGRQYYLDYQGMIFRIVLSTDKSLSYVERNDICNYYAVLMDWDPSFTSLVVPDDVFGIPVTTFSSSTGKWLGTQEAVKLMGDYADVYGSGDSQLRSLTVGANIETLGGGLRNCTQLEELVLKEGVTQISDSTFRALTGITSVVLPSTLVSIGKYVFEDCSNLTSVTFREGVTSIDLWAFRNTALTDVYLPSTLKELSPTAFDSDVVLHFTGSASANTFSWVDDNLVTHIEPTLLMQLEHYGVRVAQFQGAGLDGQDSYFISTAAAGLNRPSSELAAETALGQAAETAPILENLDVPNEVVTDAPEEPEIAEEPETVEEPKEPEEPETPPEVEEKAVVYEVMLDVVDAIRNNPLMTTLVVVGAVLLIVLGAWHRWAMNRKEDWGAEP